MKKEEFGKIELSGKAYDEFDLADIKREELWERLKQAKRGDCVKFPGETWLMKVTD